MDNIKNVKLIEIRKIDGAMLFEWDKPHPTLGCNIWMCGWNRPSNISIGEIGELEYRKTPSHSLWWFIKIVSP